jgi:urease accessory protein
VLVLGLGIVVARRHVPAWPIIAMVLFFGACHGYAHGLEIPGSANPALFTLGLLISTSALHVWWCSHSANWPRGNPGLGGEYV